MDKKAIETLSVNAVRDSIVTSDFLDQYIADNDKEPSWDGNVYIYEDKSKKKDKLKGRMPVQVKGKECEDLSQTEISHSMSLADLKNYLYDGGAVLFVVYVTKAGQKKIYYAELTPIKLRLLVAEAEKQKSKTVKLKEFPKDGNKKATIFLNCWQNCKKQSSFVDAKLHSLEELEKMGILEGITIPFEGAGGIDPKTAILNNEVYIYADIKGSDAPQPLELIPMGLTTKETVSAKVIIGDSVFYDEYSIVRNAKTTSFQIGKSLTLSFAEPTAPCKINYKNSKMLRALAVDLDFLINYIEHGYFMLNGVKLPFDTKGANFSNFDIESEKNRLEFAKRSVKVLDMLSCKEDIDLSELKGEDIRNLERLATALIDKEPVSGLKPDLPPVLNITVGKLKFTVLLRQDEAQKGKYLIFDFFKSEIGMAYKSEAGEMIPISQYAIYHANDFLEVSNLQADLFLPSFQRVKGKPTYERANWFLLDLLSAYDKSDGKRKDLLKAAKEFATWIKEAPESEIDYFIKTLNFYQVVKRERSLNIAEISELWNIAEDTSAPDACKVGAYLLLDQQVPAERYFEKLSGEEQANFTTFPIYHYWKTEDK